MISNTIILILANIKVELKAKIIKKPNAISNNIRLF